MWAKGVLEAGSGSGPLNPFENRRESSGSLISDNSPDDNPPTMLGSFSPTHSSQNAVPPDSPIRDRYPLEEGAFQPLLKPDRYRGRVLTSANSQNRKKPGLMADTKKRSTRPRIVVDGVEDLHDSFAGLLTRRMEKLNKLPPKGGERFTNDDLFSMEPNYESHYAQQHPIDDRITPSTLHVLLRSSRASVARAFPTSTTSTKEALELQLKEFESNPQMESQLRSRSADGRGGSSCPSAGSMSDRKDPINNPNIPRKKGKGRRLTVKGEKAQEFMRRTGSISREPTPTHSGQVGNANLQRLVLQQFQEIRENDIAHLEPPNLNLANEARFYPTLTDEEAPPDGIGITAPTIPLLKSHPTQKCCDLPPVPVRYENVKDERWSKSMKRLAYRGTMKPKKDEVKASEVNEYVMLVEKEKDEETWNALTDGRSPELHQDLEYVLTTNGRGDCSGVVEQLVQSFAIERKRRHEQIAEERKRYGLPSATSLTQSVVAERSIINYPFQHTCEPTFSVLDDTLAASKEFEILKSAGKPKQHTDLSAISKERVDFIQRLVAFTSTRIPEQFWLTVKSANPLSRIRLAQAKAEVLRVPDEDVKSTPDGSARRASLILGDKHLDEYSNMTNPTQGPRKSDSCSVLFPSARPVDRSQVYLLAETLDYMIDQIPNLDALFDLNVGKRILPSAEEGAEDLPASAEQSNPLLSADLRERSVQAHLVYTTAAEKVVEILDIGLSELVRQVGCVCVERGALLNSLRQSFVDITTSSINLLQYVKQRAFEEASKRCSLWEEVESLEAQLEEKEKRIKELEQENEEIRLCNQSLQLKADWMDALQSRIAEKKKRYELHNESIHLALLAELEEEFLRASTDAVTSVSEFLNEREKKENEPTGEAPIAANARQRIVDRKTAMNNIYNESFHLLSMIGDCSGSLNKLCAPLYEKISLSTLSPNANLAATKWSAVARAVGAFEKEKIRRQRVFQVFINWCGIVQKRREEEKRALQGSKSEGDFLSATIKSSNRLGGSWFKDSGVSFMTSLQGEQEKENDGSTEVAKYEQLLTQPMQQFITRNDLNEMRVFDCSPEEVNAMFERAFDFKAFLHSPWQPSDESFVLNITDVADMIHDVRVFLHEITLRIKAVQESGVMKRGMEPPPKPPAHPGVPCSLCNRKETTAEKRKRQEALQSIAREVQNRMEELTRRVQKAEGEREDARSEFRRIQQELEESLEREQALQEDITNLMQNHGQESPARWMGDGTDAPSVSLPESMVGGLPSVSSTHIDDRTPTESVKNAVPRGSTSHVTLRRRSLADDPPMPNPQDDTELSESTDIYSDSQNSQSEASDSSAQQMQEGSGEVNYDVASPSSFSGTSL